MTRSAAKKAVEPNALERRGVLAVVVWPDSTVTELLLTGEDGDRFATIRRLVGGSVRSLIIDDQDGPAAVGWIDDDGPAKGLPVNAIASALTDRVVVGSMIVTGRGRGEAESLTSVQAGMRTALERLAGENGSTRRR